MWLKKAKVPDSDAIWYLDYFKYAEFDGDVHLSCFGPEILFMGIFDPKKSKPFV